MKIGSKIYCIIFGLFCKLLYICKKYFIIMENKSITPQESLQVINDMIANTKSRMNENGFIYLFWGWIIFICALSQFVLLQLELNAFNFYPYFLVIPAGIYTWIHESKKHRQQEDSYINSIMNSLWITLAPNLALVGFLSWPAYQISPIPFLLIFLALGAIVSGSTIKSKPLIVGGIICNLIGISSMFITVVYQPIFLAGGIVSADLIPGYILRIKFNKYNA